MHDLANNEESILFRDYDVLGGDSLSLDYIRLFLLRTDLRAIGSFKRFVKVEVAVVGCYIEAFLCFDFIC